MHLKLLWSLFNIGCSNDSSLYCKGWFIERICFYNNYWINYRYTCNKTSIWRNVEENGKIIKYFYLSNLDLSDSNIPYFDRLFKSLSTIIFTSSLNFTLGFQPRTFFAFDGSDKSKSTSAGL